MLAGNVSACADSVGGGFGGLGWAVGVVSAARAADLGRHMRHRPASLDHQAGSLLPELRGALPTLARHTDNLPAGTSSPTSQVSTIRGQSQIMHELFNRSAAVVQRYQGTLDKFTGDGLMAIFGTPVALEDHPLRACISALEIQSVAHNLAAEVLSRDNVELQIRIGLNSGEVIAGEVGVGPNSYTAVGHAVGMAQRMEAPPTRAEFCAPRRPPGWSSTRLCSDPSSGSPSKVPVNRSPRADSKGLSLSTR